MTTTPATTTPAVSARPFAGVSPATLAAEIKNVAAALATAAPSASIGGKAFIHHVWAWGGFDCSLDDFKAACADAHRAGLLALSRCDLVEAFDTRDVRRSGVEYMGATFNFIRVA